jgi:hypothetical protein
MRFCRDYDPRDSSLFGGLGQLLLRNSTQVIFTVKLQKVLSKATSETIVRVATLMMKLDLISFFPEIY